MKNILITGSKGFLGKNLVETLSYNKNLNIHVFDRGDDSSKLKTLAQSADFIFHLAGVNRPTNEVEFEIGNAKLTSELVSYLEQGGHKTPILISSSTQANLENPYGQSKKAAEEIIEVYGQKSGARTYIYRLPNIFGKWSKPNYNSAVATFCHNIARELPIVVSDPKIMLNLVYVDDVVNEFAKALNGDVQVSKYIEVSPVHSKSLGEITTLIESFYKSRKERSIPDMSDAFIKKLYSTYLSFLPMDKFNYPLLMNVDERGSFTEFLKTNDRGQVSINVSKPGITRGNHWHHTKNEKFLVVSGKGTISFRQVGSDKVHTYYVSGEKLEVVDIPTGYTHNITNTGESDLVTVMWANEPFNPEKPDTNALKVES